MAAASSGSPEFDKLKKHMDGNQKVRREVEFAFSALLSKANPSNRAARFIFGAGAEWIIASAAWSAGVLTAPAGHDSNGFDLGDLLDKSRALWSVKASASKSSGQIRLINFMGDGANAAWTEPTLFVAPYYGGAVLIDPSSDPDVQDEARLSGDALVLAGGVPKRYAEANPENWIEFDVAVNDEDAEHADDYVFIKSLLDPTHFPILSKPFVASSPPSDNSRLQLIKDAAAMRDAGTLTEEQFDAAVNSILK
ncbi:hypothetical protein AB6N35_00135 [Dietzia cinnamea]|uniref:Uncharacterized protein n=1 Tax=Dietzia cinnamea TaxID=321318 RepID=A0ABV3YEV1_9ACTN|nr:hypothetical protein [Dietzia sp. CW19]MBB1052701.1 hypothetical protein [Dietzia sp. CW19]